MLRNFPWAAVADKTDQLFASFSRPYIAIICGTAVAGSCFNSMTGPIAIPIAGTIVGGYMVSRSFDKKTAANERIEQKKIDAGIVTVTPPDTAVATPAQP